MILQAQIEAVQKAKFPRASLLGKNYIKRFTTCHLELGVAISNQQDKQRHMVSKKEVYRDFFTKV